MVHGNCVSIGCYAMTDAYINEIYALSAAALQSGQPYFRVHSSRSGLRQKRCQNTVPIAGMHFGKTSKKATTISASTAGRLMWRW
ncbi:ErfK/YbiS/YcfS/YnhG family protein [Alloalcanivorax dieselolei B5]|uniref:ErfK/YbiS/YcfS/YnhG family protein n=1 Tax=Alcanivorax dieselolei (strain DSM 16502 / CGMCC 1.3690 / MCCC 1A00001 / B-5) TaxID=930169 RepID=K0CAV9_ALCDB|nr:ErfK/YbiS/YcfS/YnhG family protein [Alloalcanivorax dieselolei B5]